MHSTEGTVAIRPNVSESNVILLYVNDIRGGDGGGRGGGADSPVVDAAVVAAGGHHLLIPFSDCSWCNATTIRCRITYFQIAIRSNIIQLYVQSLVMIVVCRVTSGRHSTTTYSHLKQLSYSHYH